MIKRKNENMSVEDAFQMFINDRKLKGVSDKTLKNYEQTVKYFVKDTNIDFKGDFKAIDKDLVDRYIFILSKQNLSVSSKNHYITDLRTFLYWAMKNYYLNSFKIELLKGQSNTIHYYSDDELERLLEKPSDRSDYVECRTYTIVCFILATGARAGTITNIKLEDIDFSNKEVTYRHLKNKQSAIIPLSNTLMNILNTYLKEWDINSEWLFPEINGDQLTYNALTLGMERYCRKRGVKRRGVHALRHNFARGWIKNNGNAFALQQMLTHSDISMTKRYVKLFSNDLHNNLEQFSPLDTIKTVRNKQIFRK